ncbi:hypothetical protein [Nocardia sp. NPDC046763]|uniref:hypothetical protein n=1 Tax=Nocardia sp. NPDC046763 TaxID=3155256 RepID=UPI0033D693E8
MTAVFAQESGEQSERIEARRGVFHWCADGLTDALYPVIGAATVPVLMAAPLVAVCSAWAIRRRPRA